MAAIAKCLMQYSCECYIELTICGVTVSLANGFQIFPGLSHSSICFLHYQLVNRLQVHQV